MSAGSMGKDLHEGFSGQDKHYIRDLLFRPSPAGDMGHSCGAVVVDGHSAKAFPPTVSGTCGLLSTLAVDGDSVVTTAVYEGGGAAAIVDGQKGTATLLEGAEVVRTVAVSYATPILHQVFLQGVPSVSTTPTSSNAGPLTSFVSQSLVVGPCNATLAPSGCATVLPSTSLKNVVDGLSSVGLSTTAASLPRTPSMVVKTSLDSLTRTLFSGLPTGHIQPRRVTKSDDELTSLTWLQDSNFLSATPLSSIQGISEGRAAPLQDNKKETTPPVQVSYKSPAERKVESPTSDYGDETSESVDAGEAVSPEVENSHAKSNNKQSPQPYNPQVHIKTKPPYSFSCLIFMAIEDSGTKALPVKDIYAWIMERFPYYRNAPTGWKNSVRHNLSLNKCFQKVDKSPNMGKGSLWMVDPSYRPNLLQALSKTPFHPFSSLDRISMVSNKLVNDNKHSTETRNTVPILPRPCNDISDDGRVSSSSTAQGNLQTVPKTPLKLGSVCGNSLDPKLFPFLTRRLCGTEVACDEDDITSSYLEKIDAPVGVHSEDVDAAAAMLALKHGTPVLNTLQDLTCANGDLVIRRNDDMKLKKRKQRTTEVLNRSAMVISSSPSLDHSYISVEQKEDTAREGGLSKMRCSSYRFLPSSAKASSRDGKPSKETSSPTLSVDEAFSDDSYHSDETSATSGRTYLSSRAGNADALLNLAFVATSLTSNGNELGDDFFDEVKSSTGGGVPESSNKKSKVWDALSYKRSRVTNNNNNASLVNNNIVNTKQTSSLPSTGAVKKVSVRSAKGVTRSKSLGIGGKGGLKAWKHFLEKSSLRNKKRFCNSKLMPNC